MGDSGPSYGFRHLEAYKKMALLHITTYDNHKWIWTASSLRIFTFTSAWNISGIPSPSFALSEVVWCQTTCPKISCCLLRALSNRLLTKSRPLKFGIIDNDDCVLCNTGLESIEHLFFSCEYSAYIWSIYRLK